MDHTERTITQNDHDRHSEDAEGTEVTRLEAQHVAYGAATYKRWARCVICDWLWPMDKLIEYEGAYYCKPLRHYKDIEYDSMLKAGKF